MKYATGCAFNLDDIFLKLDKKKLKITSNLCEEINNDRHKSKLIKDIFIDALKLIFFDIISNNVTFELPTGSKKCDFHITRVADELFKIARLNGAFKDVDLLKSWFSGNTLTFNMYSNGRTREKPIHLSGRLRELLIANTNNGKLYC